MPCVRGQEESMLLMGVRLPMVPQSAEVGRKHVRETLELHCADKEAIDNAELLTSELVTNGLLHAARPGRELILSLMRDGDRSIIEVHDPSRDLPYAATPPDELSESGRGLFLVAALSTDYGIHLTEQVGKVVWFELIAWPGCCPGQSRT